jgi:hypothetical protein
MEANVRAGELRAVTIRITDGAHKVECSYGDVYPLEELKPYERICSAAIWPKQSIAGWSAYYAFRYDTPTTEFYVKPQANVSSYKVFEPDGSLHQYERMEEQPRFWAFCRKSGHGEEPLGYVRARRTEVGAANPDHVYKVSIDFGTSSTMLYRNVSGTDSNEAAVGSAFWSAPVCSPELHQDDQIVSCFIPTTPGKGAGIPYQTLLAKAEGQSAVEPNRLMGRWMFFRSLTDAKGAAIKVDRDRLEIASNLKWNAVDPADTTHFLEEIVLFAALDARLHNCGVLQVYASYPGSMMGAKANGYLDLMNTITSQIAAQTGLRLQPKDKGADAKVESVRESLAVAKAVRTRFGLDFCSIDIGGGTSDLFLCYKPRGRETNWQGRGSSLKIGARDIFLDCFRYNRGLLSEILNAGAEYRTIQRLREKYLVANPNRFSKERALKIDRLTNEDLSENQIHFLIESLLDYTVSGRVDASVADVLRESPWQPITMWPL